jgi:hypothetical protein
MSGLPTPYDRLTLPQKMMLEAEAMELRDTSRLAARLLREGASALSETAPTGCEKHTNFRSSGPFCPVCLDDQRKEAVALAEQWKGRADDAGRLSRAVIGSAPSATASETSANDFSSHKPAGEPGLTERGPSSAIEPKFKAVGYVNTFKGCTSTKYEPGRLPDGERMLYIALSDGGTAT